MESDSSELKEHLVVLVLEHWSVAE
uniref:Uncharacterized protein n=1 Tax=Arundo donax TaxID=35708 RepID=A0A0A9FSW8_ARUDO